MSHLLFFSFVIFHVLVLAVLGVVFPFTLAVLQTAPVLHMGFTPAYSCINPTVILPIPVLFTFPALLHKMFSSRRPARLY
ncbi:uncharacterized protein BDV17DRAFT_274904 [Aspergillus undulatus]|uniref:uncharacterized protein n=1 Tax=Aspergillus undulatus TaxID=1810928 RepID=UPI003CCD86BA